MVDKLHVCISLDRTTLPDLVTVVPSWLDKPRVKRKHSRRWWTEGLQRELPVIRYEIIISNTPDNEIGCFAWVRNFLNDLMVQMFCYKLVVKDVMTACCEADVTNTS